MSDQQQSLDFDPLLGGNTAEIFGNPTKTDENPGDNAEQQQTATSGPLSFTDPDFANKRFMVRANHQDMELTANEVATNLQKGLAYDKQAAELGELRKRAELADNWEAFQTAMTTNPSVALAAYAAQHGLVVGTSDGENFTPVDPTQQPAPGAPAPGQQPSATSPEMAEMRQMMEQQQAMIQALVAERATNNAAQQHGATAEETMAVQAILRERQLPASAFDMALATVRQQAALQQPQQQQNQAVDFNPTPAEMTGVEFMNHMLRQMKEGNPTLGGSAGNTLGNTTGTPQQKSLEEMTARERTEYYFMNAGN